METLGTTLDKNTLETLTKAEQLDTDLNELNVLIEGKLAFYSFSYLLLFSPQIFVELTVAPLVKL